MNPHIPNQCDDVNECAEGVSDCHRCFNVQGRYEGFIFSSKNKGRSREGYMGLLLLLLMFGIF